MADKKGTPLPIIKKKEGTEERSIVMNKVDRNISSTEQTKTSEEKKVTFNISKENKVKITKKGIDLINK